MTPYRLLESYGAQRTVTLEAQNNRSHGVPPGGPFDHESAILANALAGQEENAPLLEIALGPLTLEALEPVTLAIVGGPDGAFPLVTGDRLKILPENAHAYLAIGTGPERYLARPPRFGTAPIRVLRAPQTHYFDFEAFLAQPYRVGHASNRVGIRLEATPFPHSLSLPSEPAIPGIIQLPPSGSPIILGPDGPTIGGYPKIAVVVQADMDRLGRLHPGTEIRFQEVNLEEAHLALKQALAASNLRVAELNAVRYR